MATDENITTLYLKVADKIKDLDLQRQALMGQVVQSYERDDFLNMSKYAREITVKTKMIRLLKPILFDLQTMLK